MCLEKFLGKNFLGRSILAIAFDYLSSNDNIKIKFHVYKQRVCMKTFVIFKIKFLQTIIYFHDKLKIIFWLEKLSDKNS